MPTKGIMVAIEETPKKCFASALDWPGWSRAGKDPDAAIGALQDYTPRYALIVEAAGLDLPGRITMVEHERLPGGATTAFGAPEVTFAADRERVTPAVANKMSALLTAAWGYLDAVAAESPAELRKGPRGGGRDRDKMLDHVLEAEANYARKLGLRLKPPARDDLAAIEEQRLAIAAVIGAASDGGPVQENGWTTRYAARRIAWHVLDHAWEMEDKRP